MTDLWQQGGFALALAMTLSALGVLWKAYLRAQKERAADSRILVAVSERVTASLDANTRVTEALYDAIQSQGLVVRPRRQTGKPA